MPDATSEQLYRGLLRGPLRTQAGSKSNQWAGRTTLNSGSATVTVSTTAVDSNSIVLGFTEGAANLASGTAIRGIEVKSLSPGNFVTFGTADGQAIARATAIMWLIVPQQ